MDTREFWRFTKLQQTVTTAPTLLMLDFSHKFSIECDASGKGIGFCWCSKRRVAYFNNDFVDFTLAKPAYEKELMTFIEYSEN